MRRRSVRFMGREFSDELPFLIFPFGLKIIVLPSRDFSFRLKQQFKYKPNLFVKKIYIRELPKNNRARRKPFVFCCESNSLFFLRKIIYNEKNRLIAKRQSKERKT